MSTVSVLFLSSDDQAAAEDGQEPDYFADLNLDQVVAALTTGREDYDLAPFFHTRLSSVAAVSYRHEVFRDLEDDALSTGLAEFAAGLRDMRGRLSQADRLRHRYQRRSWFLDAAEAYQAAVAGLARTLQKADLASRGLRSVRDHVAAYVRSAAFETLTADIERVRQALAAVHCCLTIKDGSVKVTRYAEEPDYGAEVLAAFEKFKQAEAKSYRVSFRDFVDMNHVEEQILDRIALLYPEVFAELDAFADRHADFVDPDVRVFDREVQFYLSYDAFVARLRETGLRFCHPEVSRSKRLLGQEVFDIALAAKLAATRTPVVPNDFHLEGPERVIVVSGPNQGGKTTFARTFGQLHHLAALGCPVPGTRARLFLCDRIFTHFERGENLKDLSGKLKDDLVRVHDILHRATGDSIVIMNEVFTSTTLQDAIVLGTRVLEQIIELDLLCVCVTFVDELASLGPSTVSMVSTVVPGNPTERTFRVIRRPADGLSYAMALADKYGITYERLTRRIGAPGEGKAAS